jgi:hypothetical protein
VIKLISILIFYSFSYQATPRLGEDKVKQCVDPRLNGEYPPKGVAKVYHYSQCICACEAYFPFFNMHLHVV